jgi:hypothetical protein
VQGSSHDGMVAVAFLVFQYGQISDNNTSISLPARNLRKEINIKTIQRNYDGVYKYSIIRFKMGIY